MCDEPPFTQPHVSCFSGFYYEFKSRSRLVFLFERCCANELHILLLSKNPNVMILLLCSWFFSFPLSQLFVPLAVPFFYSCWSGGCLFPNTFQPAYLGLYCSGFLAPFVIVPSVHRYHATISIQSQPACDSDQHRGLKIKTVLIDSVCVGATPVHAVRMDDCGKLCSCWIRACTSACVSECIQALCMIRAYPMSAPFLHAG